jgi:hypothetical protein
VRSRERGGGDSVDSVLRQQTVGVRTTPPPTPSSLLNHTHTHTHTHTHRNKSLNTSSQIGCMGGASYRGCYPTCMGGACYRAAVGVEGAGGPGGDCECVCSRQVLRHRLHSVSPCLSRGLGLHVCLHVSAPPPYPVSRSLSPCLHICLSVCMSVSRGA